MSLIEIHSLAKYYQKDFCAIKDLDLSIEEGDFVTIVGPFGCGKSSLLELIAGIREGYEGVIKIRGQSPEKARLRRKIGYGFQRPTLLPWRNVIKNIMLPLEIVGEKNEVQAYELLEMVGLKHLAYRMPRELSGGMQQLISIVRSLVLDPDILLLDEPFSSIDEINRMKMHTYLLQIHKQTNKTMVLVTHSLSEAVYLSDKVVVLTPNPAKVKKNIDINLSTHNEEILFSEEFLNYVKIIKKELINDPKSGNI